MSETKIENDNIASDAAIAISKLANASGQAWRTATLNINVGATTRLDVPLTAGSNNKVNITHSTSTNPERMTVSIAGVYRVTYMATFTDSTAGFLPVITIWKNTSEIAESFRDTGSPAGYYVNLTGTCLVTLAANDYIKMSVASNRPTTEDTVASNYSAICAMVTMELVG